jgi:hypothetical protein
MEWREGERGIFRVSFSFSFFYHLVRRGSQARIMNCPAPACRLEAVARLLVCMSSVDQVKQAVMHGERGDVVRSGFGALSCMK